MRVAHKFAEESRADIEGARVTALLALCACLQVLASAGSELAAGRILALNCVVVGLELPVEGRLAGEVDGLLVLDVVAVAVVRDEEGVREFLAGAVVVELGVLETSRHCDCDGLLGDQAAVLEFLQGERLELAVGEVETVGGLGDAEQRLQMMPHTTLIGGLGDFIAGAGDGLEAGLGVRELEHLWKGL